jgi:purine-binding chemotaxis protein CheW
VKNLVTFLVGGSRYALPADVVAECVEIGPITEGVPVSGGGRLGLACVRDRWVPVIELVSAVPGAPRLDPDAESSVLLMLGRSGSQLGLRVEGFDSVVGLDGSVAYERRMDDLIELNGELVHYVDPAALLASGAPLFWKEGGSMEENSVTAEPRQVVALRVGGEEFGVDVMKVKRVLKVPEIRVVPRAPDFVKGVVSVSGSVVPVIDMRKRFSAPVPVEEAPGALMIVEARDSLVGLVVDEVPGVVEIAEDAVSSAPDFFRGLAGRYLDGIAEEQGRLIILLNLDEVLSSKERIALEKMLKEANGEADQGDPAAGEAKRKKGGGRRKKKAKS